MRIDLHTHSLASDGSEVPADLVASAAAAGIDVVALTDHDTCAGWDEAMRAAQAPGAPVVVPGVEISCRREGAVDADAKSEPIGLHLLGYAFDPAHPELADELARIRHDRVPRAKAIVRRMTEVGLPITWDAVLARTTKETVVGRPHIADAMIDVGLVSSREEAFSAYLHRRSEFYVGHRAMDPVEAVRRVKAAGGVTVVAHPRAARRGARVPDSLLIEMTTAGLTGLEVDHPDQEPAERYRLRMLAEDLGLVVTGSSDYHGTGKVNRLGEETTEPEMYEALLARATYAGPGTRPVAG